MREVMETMERMPALRSKMIDKLGRVAEGYDQMKGKEGQEIGDRIRIRLADKMKRDKEL